MTAFSPARCAAALMGARRVPRGVRQPLGVFSPGARPMTREDGVAAQVALAELSDQAAPAGFKIGATAPRMQEYLGIDAPIGGFMARDNLHASGSTISYAPFLNPGVECELAVHLGQDLPPRATTMEEAAAAVEHLMCGIEIVENRYPALDQLGVPTLLADQMFHAAAILGEPMQDWRLLDLASLHGEIIVDGEVYDSGEGRDLYGHPMAALAWLAGSMEAAGFGGLRAGQVVMLGSVCPPVWLGGPADVEVRFEGMPPVTLALV